MLFIIIIKPPTTTTTNQLITNQVQDTPVHQQQTGTNREACELGCNHVAVVVVVVVVVVDVMQWT